MKTVHKKSKASGEFSRAAKPKSGAVNATHAKVKKTRSAASPEPPQKKKFTPLHLQALPSDFDFRSYKPIEDYGIIGDLHSIALVGRDGSIDWCCLPHFDSPSIFAAILDCHKGGFFKIAPVMKAVNKQMYLPESCVLTTRFLAKEGVAEVIDFMPLSDVRANVQHVHQIIRRVRGVRGTMRFKIHCEPAFNYARDKHYVRIDRRGAVFVSENMELGLLSSIPLHRSGNSIQQEFVIKEGEEVDFILRQVEKGHPRKLLEPVRGSVNQLFEKTVEAWRHWSKGVHYDGRWREMVKRSAMTLKLLTFNPTGAIVAAPTTSLPEELGGVRNWDYRYTWIRDAAFTVYAFMRLGLATEAERFMDWITERAQEERPDGSMQIMYGIHGEHRLKEFTLKHLSGYRGSAPVRVGNAAYDQLQLDIYGELLDSVYLYNKYGKPISYELWKHLRRLLNFTCKNWMRKDEGIWEVRGGRQHFTYSKLMCWVALDRGIRLMNNRGFPAERDMWYGTRDKIYEAVMSKGWNEKLGSFTQTFGGKSLDASNLIMPLVFFIAPTDPRMIKTIDATIKKLSTDGLVYRYNPLVASSDGLPGEEGTFSMCTFWLVEALTRAGRLDEARYIFEKIISYSNHLGLYAEEIGSSGEALGNFPQAFTHLSLISAAFNLDRALNENGRFWSKRSYEE